METKERSGPVDAFVIDGRVYEHRIFMDTDDRIECIDMADNTVLIFTADCKVKKPDGTCIGRFNMVHRRWSFTTDTDIVLDYGFDLLQAEVEVSKLYLKGELR